MIAHKDSRTSHRSSYVKAYDSCGVARETQSSKLSSKRYEMTIVGFPESPSKKRKIATEVLRRAEKSAAARKKKSVAPSPSGTNH